MASGNFHKALEMTEPEERLQRLVKRRINVSKGEVNEYQADLEFRKCRMSLMYYLTHYVIIQDRVLQEQVAWQDWAHLTHLVNLVQAWADKKPREPMYLVIFKSRQMGASTIITAIGVWLATFFDSTKVIFQSKDERTASEMLERARFICEHHPKYLRLKIFPNQDDIAGFPATNSKIITIPSTEDAGKSTDATFVACDEWEAHRRAREGFAAVKPPMAKGCLFIGVSTVDKTNMESFPKEIWAGAKRGENGFIPLFWDYFQVPGRTEATWQRDTQGLSDYEREAQYPRNEKEALSAPKSLGYFNHDILDKMLAETRNPVDARYGGKVNIYTPSTTSRKFVMAVDSSEGVVDETVAIVADAQTSEDCASINGKMPLDESAKLIYEIYKEYNEPLICVERNASGLALIEKLKNLGIKNWFYSDAAKTKEGWFTASGANRDKMLLEFQEEILLRRKRIPIKDAILQMYHFAIIDGKPQAVRGRHDDWVMAEALLNMTIKSGIAYNQIRFYNFKYR